MNPPPDIRDIGKLKLNVGTPQSAALTVRLMRHVVAIYFDFMLANHQRRQFAHTAFAFSVEDRWLLMTAGHCVTAIEQARAQGGELKKCLLFDCMGENAVWAHPVPFAYDSAYPMNIGVKEDVDYGVLFPPLNTCRLLQANKVVPFDESSWDAEPVQVQDYFLLGFPAELNVYNGNLVNVKASMFRLTRYAERPEEFPETDEQLYFYGRVIEHPLDSLKGVSGGPIVALTPADELGSARYYLVAMQSTRMGSDIKGMLMPPLGAFIRDLVKPESV
jgi:hypothetical protein